METHPKRFTTLTYELKDSTPSLMQDILTDDGFIEVLKMVVRVRRTGIALLAPVCSSWCWLNRHTSGRSRLDWEGHTWVPSVRDGDLMVSRTILLLWVLAAMGCVYILEQPQGSILDAHARFQEFIKEHVVWRVLAFPCLHVQQHTSMACVPLFCMSCSILFCFAYGSSHFLDSLYARFLSEWLGSAARRKSR